MHFRKSVLLCLFLFLCHTSITQEAVLYEDQFTKMSTDIDRLTAYIDTAHKYLYLDVDISLAALDASKEIIDKTHNIPDSLIFKYKFQKIYQELNMLQNLDAFKTVMDCETDLNWGEISSDDRTSFNYIKGFTFMIFGDLEAAQKAYYENIVLGKKNNKYGSVINNLYSLGQLYNDEQDYEAAIECFDEALELTKIAEIKQSTLALIYIEKSESLGNQEKLVESLNYLEKAFNNAEKNKIQILKSDIRMLQGMNYLKQGKIDMAENIYLIMNKNITGNNDQNNIANTKLFLVLLSKEKKEYRKALIHLNELMNKVDSTNLDRQIKNFTLAHELHNELGNYKYAYEYSLAVDSLKIKKETDVKRQKTAYLKVKYESEEREKDNTLLKLEIQENLSQQRILYAVVGLAGLILLFFIGAFYQKARYNKKLEHEVERRTDKLNKSNILLHDTNQELSEFNQILSHDLKEPARVIVSLSQLANKNRENPIKLQEQLSHVTDSAKQLSVLIDDVEKYRNIDHINIHKKEEVDIKSMLQKIIEVCNEKYPEKEIILNTENLKVIHAAPNLLKLIFKYLIDNSCKFNNQDAIKIHIAHKAEKSQNTFTIKDNGIGIPKKFHQHVFERFKRLNLRNEYNGSGLGLSIAKKLIEKINGSIVILQSVENEGTTIEVAFPE